MNRRSRAREVVLQVLFQDDLNPRVNPGEADQFVQARLKHDETYAFAQELIKGVRQNRPELDAHLERIADNWSLVRMAVTDRNILRLGAYEILFTQTPERVAINEAVELAKKKAGLGQATVVTYRRAGEYQNNVYSRLVNPAPGLANLDLLSLVRGGTPQFMYLWMP